MVSQGNVGSEAGVQLWVLGVVLVDSLLDLVSVVANQPLYWPGCSVTQSANCVALDLLGQLPQHVDLSIVSLTDFHPLQNVSQP